MTKKHFIELADVIKRESGQNARFSDVQIETLATFCQNQNPRFSRSRWLGYIAGTKRQKRRESKERHNGSRR